MLYKLKIESDTSALLGGTYARAMVDAKRQPKISLDAKEKPMLDAVRQPKKPLVAKEKKECWMPKDSHRNH